MTSKPRLPAAMLPAALFAFALSGAEAMAAEQGRVIESADRAVLASRERVEPENAMLTERLENLLPRLMEETGIDMWLVLNREYAEDPVYFTLVPQPSFAARRTTMLVFHRHDDGSFERLTVNRYPLGEPYESAWEGGSLDEQWQALADLIAERDPERIGINVSDTWPEADGLTHGLHRKLTDALPEGLADRLVPAEALVVRWLETRSEGELAVYPHVVSIARGVIAEAFSSRVITPGVTSTDDVAWFIRQRFEALGLDPWFMPYVNIQRPSQECGDDKPFCGTAGTIQPGDVLHTDVGICYLKLCTDTQEMGYVLRPARTRFPKAWSMPWPRATAGRMPSPPSSSPAAPATKCLPPRRNPWPTNPGLSISTPTPSASSATVRGRPSACGTCPPRSSTPAIGRCMPTPPTPSKAASRPRCRRGTITWSTSSSSRPPCSTASG